MLYSSKSEGGVVRRGGDGGCPWISSIWVIWELLEMPDLRFQSWSMETDCILTRSPGDMYARYCLRSSARKFMVNKVLSYKLFIWRGRGNWIWGEWLTTEGHLAGTRNLLPSTGLELFPLDYFASWWQSKGNNSGNGRFHCALTPTPCTVVSFTGPTRRGPLLFLLFSKLSGGAPEATSAFQTLSEFEFPSSNWKQQETGEWHIDRKIAVQCWTSSLTSHDSSKKWGWTTWPSGQFPVLKFEDSKSFPWYLLINFLVSSSDLRLETICPDQRWQIWVGGRAIFYCNRTDGELHPNAVPSWLASPQPKRLCSVLG